MFQNYAHLRRISGENAHYLHLIESSLFLLTLEPDFEPRNQSEIVMRSLVGDYNNLWVDKSLHVAFFGNGQSGGLAEVSIDLSSFCYSSCICDMDTFFVFCIFIAHCL